MASRRFTTCLVRLWHSYCRPSSSPVATSDMEQTRPRLVIRSLRSRIRVLVSLSMKKKLRIYTPALSLNICPSYTRLNLATNSSVLKAMYARECKFSLFSLTIHPISVTEHDDSHWHLLLFHLTRAILLPNDGIIRHPRLHGLPKYRFREVRGQSAHDSLEPFRPVSLRLSLALFLGLGS